jgi:restriction endonuclease S subunit
MAFNQDMRALMPTGAIDPDFLLYALRVRKSALVQEIGTSAHGTRRMGSASIENLPVPVPRDESEQKEIATVLNDLDKMEEAATAKCSSLKLLFSSMLNQLVTGAISVKDLDLAEVSHA